MSRTILKVVIDASVARASGTKEEVPSSTLCRQFLEEFRRTDNKLLMTSEIYKEWNKHESSYARTWRSNMIATKRMEVISDTKHLIIREAVETYIDSDKIKKEVIKDLHLVEAAVASDNYVISNDNKIRTYLIDLACSCLHLRELIWVNPTNENEDGLFWLKNGCARDTFRKIGYSSDNEAAPHRY